MKKITEKPLYYWLLSTLLYFIFLVLVMFAICVYPISEQFPNMIKLANRSASSYIYDNEFYDTTGFDYLYLINNKDELIFNTQSNFPWVSLIPNADLIGMAHDLQNGITPRRWYFDFEFNDVLLISGVKMEKDGQYIGASLIMRNVKNLPEAIEGSIIAFTVFYWLFVLLFSLEIRRRKRYKVLEANYVANVTHALKAPIASVRAVTEALIDVVPAESDKQQPYFGEILRETALQSHMVQEILDLSKVQSGRVDFSKSVLNASEVFAETFEKYQTYCELAGIPLHISDSFERMHPLYSNAHCLNEIMNILLENAVKYVEDGEIRVVPYKKGKTAVIEVTNTKGVIDAEDIPRVFDRFFTGKNKEMKDGTGLGLSIAQALTFGLKERIWVDSSQVNGTTFSFTVRLK